MKDFYRFWEGQQEPWDGPALLVWSDGKKVGACLDRNGLRPARYMTLKDGTVLMMSETGVLPVDESQVISLLHLQIVQYFGKRDLRSAV